MRIWFWHQYQQKILGVVTHVCDPSTGGRAEIGRSLGRPGQPSQSNQWTLCQWEALSQKQREQFVRSNTWNWSHGDVHTHIFDTPPPPNTLTKGCPISVLLTLRCASGSVLSVKIRSQRVWVGLELCISKQINLMVSGRNHQLCEHTVSLKNLIYESGPSEVS